jgi:aspartate carbamoyltransferase regulatory subunit
MTPAKKLFIATPMYGGNCSALYALSMANLANACGVYGIPIEWKFLYNDALITRARNQLVEYFLMSDADYLIFIDGDIQFNHLDVLCLADLALKNKKMQIIAGAYPKKTINWTRVKTVHEMNMLENPNDVENYIGNYVFNLKSNKKVFPLNKPFKVEEAGTGFMLIKREVFEKFKEAYPEQTYLEYETNEPMTAYFDCKIDSKEKRYLSEDYMFCQYASKIGIDTWLVPWINLNHMGSYLFKGSLNNVASMEYQVSQQKESSD